MEEVIDMRQLIESISKTKWYLNPGPPWLELIVLSSLQHQVTTQVVYWMNTLVSCHCSTH